MWKQAVSPTSSPPRPVNGLCRPCCLDWKTNNILETAVIAVEIFRFQLEFCHILPVWSARTSSLPSSFSFFLSLPSFDSYLWNAYFKPGIWLGAKGVHRVRKGRNTKQRVLKGRALRADR